LSLPDLQQPFEIEIDASDYVVGVVFTQLGHPVVYHSETLLDAVEKYPTMIRRYIPLDTPINDGSITFSLRRKSSTLITSLRS
jgi:hypothetical protein